jgi:Lantibiotic dehydratase, N terminus
LPLGKSGWSLWREVALRSAGFPARRVEALRDDDLAASADAVDSVEPANPAHVAYEAAFAAGLARLSAALVDIASDPPFREAVTWQNLAVVANHLDHVVNHRPPVMSGQVRMNRNKRTRRDEVAIANYLQRYCLKNETIGFFGPVGWARISPTGPALSATPGPKLLARRTTYFEVWAIDALGDTISDQPGMLRWLTPRVGIPVNTFPPNERPTLSAAEEDLVLRCDGTRTVADHIGTDPDVVEALKRLLQLHAVRLDLWCSMQAWPERELGRRLEGIGDADLRGRGQALLAELISGRDAVAAAAGDAEKVRATIAALDTTFERLTGSAPTRRAGGTYAGRTLLYEDCLRDVDVQIGPALLDALAGPLGLVLESVQWLVGTIAGRLQDRFATVLDEERVAAGRGSVPLMRMFARAGDELGEDPELRIAQALAEFQDRWRRVLDLPPDVRRYAVPTDAIADRVAQSFPRIPGRWRTAGRHSVDIMIAASGVEAIDRGDFQLVLSQLHVASNALDTRALVEQHKDPARLLAANEADHADGRVYAIPPKYANVSSRVSPPSALLSPRFTYVSLGAESVVPPPGSRTLSAAGLLVDRRGDGLVVRDPSSGDEFDLLEVIAENLSGAVHRLFRPMVPAPHTPRVTIDRLVLWRETWIFPAPGIAWAFVKNEQRRYALARRWRRQHELPERVFARLPSEVKPTAVDFRSLVLVNLFAKAIRTAAAAAVAGSTADVSISEMLPDIEDLWLADAEGNRYSSELRFVAVDGG